tara:strand:+ start:376 stop:1293 length:918 start_codon:yes stop_codon:yes gene_type:complete
MKISQHKVTNLLLAGILVNTITLTIAMGFGGVEKSSEIQSEVVTDSASNATKFPSIKEKSNVVEEKLEQEGYLLNTDPVSTALEMKLKELESKKRNKDEKASKDTSKVSETASDDSCYVKNGNFSQPKFAYDSECNELPENKKERKIALALSKLPDSMLVTFKAEKEKEVLYVVTDYTCPYCQKLDSKIEEFTNAGFTVKYIFYPRAIDYGSQYADKARTVVDNMTNAFCAEDQVEGVKYLYDNKEAPFADCSMIEGRINAPIREHYMLAHLLGVEYTPAVFSSSGKLSYGFRSVSTTLRDLGAK